VKFQTFRTEDFVSRKDKARFERLKSFELTQAQFERLSIQARALGLLFISTPLELGSAAFLDGIADALKIASGDNTFYPLLETVARTGKPLILSGGLADTRLLATVRAHIHQVWAETQRPAELAILHCVTSYPVEPAQANLAAIRNLQTELGGTVGYSDHTLGIEAAVLAVALGARIIEKHFTLDKNQSDFRDHKLSADPPELAELVRRVKEARILLGNGAKIPQDCERALEPVVRRSIAARRNLPAGTILTRADLTWLRPAGGLPPGQEHLLLGKRLAQPCAAGDLLRIESLEDLRAA
jgi:N,N'-diacetyllegionaminate synthase